MKKLILILGFVIASLIGYSQATAVGEFRVATTSTAFGVNLPTGTKIYCIADSTYWVLKAPAGSALTLGTVAAPDKFQLNKTAVDTDDQNLTWDAVNGHIEISEGNDADVGSFGTANTNYGFVIGSNGETTKFLRGDNTWQTVITTEVDGSATNEGVLDVIDYGTTGAAITSNTSGSPNVTFESQTAGLTIEPDNDTINFTITPSTLGVKTALVEWFEVPANDLTIPYEITLSQTPSATTIISLQLNGQPVKYAAGTDPGTFNFVTTTLSLYVPVYQYDAIEVRYQY